MVSDFLQWWYGAGLRAVYAQTMSRARGVLETFSVGLLARTLFSPFRQIDAGGVRGPLGVQLQAWAGRQFSRFFGAGLRLIMIIIGLVGSLLVFVGGIIWSIIWLGLPVLPVVGLVLWLTGASI